MESLRVGVEALVRCHEPGRGELAPVDLIRLAEDAGLITDITEHVLATALPQVQAWKVLPASERAAIAREAVAAFVERVEAAAQTDPRAHHLGAR